MSKFHKKSAPVTPRNQKPNWFLALQFDNPDIIAYRQSENDAK
jgi:hypothetical protein